MKIVSAALAAATLAVGFAAPAFAQDKGTIGIAMPTRSLERWNNDGTHLEKLLKDAGYQTSLQYADNKVDQQITSTQADLDHTSAQLRKAYDALEVTRTKLPAARAKAEQAAAAEIAAQSRYDDAAAALRVAEADEAKARKDIATTTAQIAQAREHVAGFAGEVYQQQGATAHPGALTQQRLDAATRPRADVAQPRAASTDDDRLLAVAFDEHVDPHVEQRVVR